MTSEQLENRIAVCSWSLHPTSPAELIHELRLVGIYNVQLYLTPLHTQRDVWGRTPDMLREAGVRVISGMFGCVGENYSTLQTIRDTGGVVPDQTWPATWETIQHVAPIARRMRLPLVTFHAGFLPEDKKDPSFDKLCDRLTKIADLFADFDCKVGFETGQESAGTLKKFLDELNHPNIGVNFDPANMILYDKGDPIPSLKTLGSYVVQCHIKDAIRTKKKGTWGTEVPVGTGDVDWSAFLKTVDQIKFAGPLVIEREAGDTRIVDIRQAKQHLPAALNARRSKAAR